jgi:hypothetical protein
MVKNLVVYISASIASIHSKAANYPRDVSAASVRKKKNKPGINPGVWEMKVHRQKSSVVAITCLIALETPVPA